MTDDPTVAELIIAELEEVEAETERVLTEGKEIEQQAIETMNQAIPMVVNHLNTLSDEEQRVFLKQVRDQMVSLAPSELQSLYAQNPELKDQGYNRFLEMLRENGWTGSR